MISLLNLLTIIILFSLIYNKILIMSNPIKLFWQNQRKNCKLILKAEMSQMDERLKIYDLKRAYNRFRTKTPHMIQIFAERYHWNNLKKSDSFPSPTQNKNTNIYIFYCFFICRKKNNTSKRTAIAV